MEEREVWGTTMGRTKCLEINTFPSFTLLVTLNDKLNRSLTRAWDVSLIKHLIFQSSWSLHKVGHMYLTLQTWDVCRTCTSCLYCVVRSRTISVCPHDIRFSIWTSYYDCSWTQICSLIFEHPARSLFFFWERLWTCKTGAGNRHRNHQLIN